MKKLNPKSAKIIAQKYFKKIKPKIEQDFAQAHSEAVVEISIILAKKMKANSSVVETAAWVHDIGRVIGSDNHAEHSLKLLEKEGYQIEPMIEDCILNHGSSGQPKSKEAIILQAADKLSILSIPILKLLLKQKSISASDIKYLVKMTTGAIKRLEGLNF